MRPTIADAVDLQIPADWRDATLLTFVGPPTDHGQASLVVGRDALAGADLAGYAREQLARLRDETDGFTAHAAGLDDQGRFVAEHTFAVHGAPPVRQIQVYVARDDAVFTLSVTHPEAALQAARATIDAIARSFRAR